MLCFTGAGIAALGPGGIPQELLYISPEGTVLWRYALEARNHLRVGLNPRVGFAPDGSAVYFAATHEDGRRGIWAMPTRGGEARLVIVADDPALVLPGWLSTGPDRLYVTVSQYESDIWVMDLKY
ncbi:MAG: hypothetical protein FIA95_02865 [Gemmatimonadetes bacterium]|nr:hypothetical protein [Gemmatimonadota bacterium]